jgi:thiol-disulfide isomerase/thioredoxin
MTHLTHDVNREATVMTSKAAQRVLRVLIVLLFPLAALAQAPPPSGKLVTGTVIDAQGRAVAGARVGTGFRFGASFAETKTVMGYADSQVVTDARGAFSLPAAAIAWTKVLVASGPGDTLGFVVRGSADTAEIRLLSPAKLDVQFAKPFGAKNGVSFDVMAGGSAVGYGEAIAGVKSTVVVPAGAVEVHAFNAESIGTVNKLSLPPLHVTPLHVTLRPTSWARNIGKPAPPLTPTDVQNLARGESLDHLRGKWVLVDFWATWCLPCVQEMPKITAFYESHAKMRDRFEIVGVHSAEGGASFAAIQPDYQRFVQGPWKGKAPSFPLVFDSTGKTQKQWGIESYPTMLLVDPKGALVGLATLEDLAKRLE